MSTTPPHEKPLNREDIYKYFRENYRIIGHGVFGVGSKIYIGNKNNRKCRFCGKDQNEAKFTQLAHAIPEFLGNRQLILLDECDECNTFFSQHLEDHLDKYTKPFRTIFQIKGKEKIPSYKSRDKNSRIDVGDSVAIKTISESGFIHWEENASQFKMNLDFEPHIPAAVYKALVKIALSIIKDDKGLEGFKYTIRWIRNPDHSKQIFRPLKIWETFIPGPKRNSVVNCMLLRKKEKNPEPLLMGNRTPYSIFILHFSNIIYQIIVPSHFDVNSDGPSTFAFPNIPLLLPVEQKWQYGKPMCGLIDVSDYSKVTKSETIIMHYDERIELKKIRARPLPPDRPPRL